MLELIAALHGFYACYTSGKVLSPDNQQSIARAHCRPSRIAQTTSD